MLKRNDIVQRCIDEHYAEYNGHLPYNGVIQGYQLIINQCHEIINRIEYDLPQYE